MTQNHKPLEISQAETPSKPAVRLLRDDSGIMTLTRAVAVVAFAFAALVGSRPVADILASSLYRIYIIVTLLMH